MLAPAEVLQSNLQLHYRQDNNLTLDLKFDFIIPCIINLVCFLCEVRLLLLLLLVLLLLLFSSNKMKFLISQLIYYWLWSAIVIDYVPCINDIYCANHIKHAICIDPIDRIDCIVIERIDCADHIDPVNIFNSIDCIDIYRSYWSHQFYWFYWSYWLH